MFHGKAKAQSAMEYLMTYGWAILLIAVVLGALYQLGVFGNTQNTLAASCLSTTGFLCQSPTLNSSGYLAVKFGQISYTSITVTNIACTQNTTAPTATSSVNLQLSSGATAIVAFSCPLASNSLGSSFKGYLWITYNTPLQSGVVDRFAVVTGQVTTAGSVISILGAGPSAGGPQAQHFIYCVGGYPTSPSAGITTGVYYAPIYGSGAVGSWASTNAYPVTMEDTSCNINGGYLYCVGGYNGASASPNVYYSPLIANGVGAWVASNSYPISVYGYPSQCGISGSSIYCAGGFGSLGSTVANTYYAPLLSPGVGSWTASTALTTAKSGPCPIYGGNMYCVGGYTTAYSNLDSYASVSGGGIGSWSATTLYPITDGTQCVTSGGYVYCIAGYSGSVALAQSYYAPLSGGVGAWSATTAYPANAYGHSCSVSSGNVYCVGIDHGGTGDTSVYYAPLSSAGIGAWTSANSYPTAIRYTACAST